MQSSERQLSIRLDSQRAWKDSRVIVEQIINEGRMVPVHKSGLPRAAG